MKIIMPFIVVILLLLAQPVHSEKSNTNATPWFTIELVLFTRNTPPSATGEIWPVEPGKLDWDSVRTGNYASVPRGSWKLTGAKLGLKQGGEGLNPVIHTAWQQPVYSRNSARSVYIQSDRQITPGTPLVEGMVKVSVSRYLHVDLDLIMRGIPTSTVTLPGGFQTFRFNEHRRMRSKEIHYIDHPLMGMLILITPHSAPNPQPAEDDAAQDSENKTGVDEASKPE